MELSARLEAPCSPSELFGWVDDLATYTRWMGLVHRAEALPAATDDPSAQPRWDVELRARIGPFARSKRLTMARVTLVQDERVVFERRESDGRRHGMWRLSAVVEPTPTGSVLEMGLHYGGSLWTGGIVERVLHDEIDRSRDRLVSLIDSA